jgi:hypothetical protein
MSQNRNAHDEPEDHNDEWDRETADEPGSQEFAGEGETASSQTRPGGVRPVRENVPGSAVTSDEEQRVEIAPEEVPASNQPCVMLGPARSGKTTLLTAIKRACDQPSEDELDLEFIPHKETAEKIRIAIHKIVERQQGHDATKDVGTYPFDVHISAKAPNFWSPPLEADLHVVMSDGAGGFLLPSIETISGDQSVKEFRETLIQTALNATSMILCIDVTRPGSTLLEKELAISFAEMSKATPFSSTVHWTAKLWARLRRRPVPRGRTRWKRCLNVDRFLLLLTQVDKLCHRLPHSIERTVRFAEMIDPVEQARELLGVPVLKTVQNTLKPGARFAVGVISAMGFHPLTGDPFADIDGKPLNLPAETGEDILRRWTPFGIRDAIYFLATGECRGRVKELRADDLRSGTEPMEFTYSE